MYVHILCTHMQFFRIYPTLFFFLINPLYYPNCTPSTLPYYTLKSWPEHYKLSYPQEPPVRLGKGIRNNCL